MNNIIKQFREKFGSIRSIKEHDENIPFFAKDITKDIESFIIDALKKAYKRGYQDNNSHLDEIVKEAIKLHDNKLIEKINTRTIDLKAREEKMAVVYEHDQDMIDQDTEECRQYNIGLERAIEIIKSE